MENLPGRSGIEGRGCFFKYFLPKEAHLSCPTISPQPNCTRTPPPSTVPPHTDNPASEATPPSVSGFSPVIQCCTGVPAPPSLCSGFIVPGFRTGLVVGLRVAPFECRDSPAWPGPVRPSSVRPTAGPVLAAPWSLNATTPCTSRPCRCRRARSWRGTQAGTERCPGGTICTWGRPSASCWCCAAGAARGPGSARVWAPGGPGPSWRPPWLLWPRSALEAGCPGAVAPESRTPSPQGVGIPGVGACSEAAAPFSPTARAQLPQGERPR
jgi:hypothetical protein